MTLMTHLSESELEHRLQPRPDVPTSVLDVTNSLVSEWEQPSSKFWWKAWNQRRLLINRSMTMVVEWHVGVSTYFWPCTERDKLVCALWWTNYVMATLSKLPQTQIFGHFFFCIGRHVRRYRHIFDKKSVSRSGSYVCLHMVIYTYCTVHKHYTCIHRHSCVLYVHTHTYCSYFKR